MYIFNKFDASKSWKTIQQGVYLAQMKLFFVMWYFTVLEINWAAQREVVCRGSETQLQVSENFNYLILLFNGWE